MEVDDMVRMLNGSTTEQNVFDGCCASAQWSNPSYNNTAVNSDGRHISPGINTYNTPRGEEDTDLINSAHCIDRSLVGWHCLAEGALLPVVHMTISTTAVARLIRPSVAHAQHGRRLPNLTKHTSPGRKPTTWEERERARWGKYVHLKNANTTLHHNIWVILQKPPSPPTLFIISLKHTDRSSWGVWKRR